MKIKVKSAAPQAAYAASLLDAIDTDLTVAIDTDGQGSPEGFTLSRKGKRVTISGNDGPGCIYGANRLLEEWRQDPSLAQLTTIADAPQMVMRGTCVGLQKTEYLPGHRVYEYPYTPENFPWFYDKELWLKYLDLLASCDMNTLYLWNGHPFASLVKLPDYPFATEVDDATMAKNQEMFGFLVDEADRRGIRIIQMFYNIIVSKPFADHYGIKTQDRNRPITSLIADYTRKSIAAFVKKYPRVGFLVCLGEAMSGLDTDIRWMTETIIPGILDGLRGEGQEVRGERQESHSLTSHPSPLTSLPPIILRNHDTDVAAALSQHLHHEQIYGREPDHLRAGRPLGRDPPPAGSGHARTYRQRAHTGQPGAVALVVAGVHPEGRTGHAPRAPLQGSAPLPPGLLLGLALHRRQTGGRLTAYAD